MRSRAGRRAAFGALAAALALAGCGDSGSGPANRFDADAAWKLVEQQVAVGQRPAGSPQLRALALRLKGLLPDGRFESIPGQPRLRNVVGTLPGRRPGIVLGAHYDTLATPPGFVGANNGAAGTAVVIEAAHALQQLESKPAAREVRFVLFDGEEPPSHLPSEGREYYDEGLRGSKAYVAANPNRTREMILVDYVGNRGLFLPREINSTGSLWKRLLIASKTVGASRFFSGEIGQSILDDHSPFLESGVPAVDLIDWSYPGQTLADGLDKLSRQSLDGVGETVVQLIAELREE